MQYPIEKLHYSITESLSQFEIVRKAIEMGLKSEVKLTEEIKGHKVFSTIDSNGQVYLSLSFCQFIWNMCYAAMIITDSNRTDKELKSMGVDKKTFSALITPLRGYPEVDFLLSEFGAMDWKRTLILGMHCFYRDLTPDMEKEIENQDMDSLFSQKVNSLYRAAISFALLHELFHWVNQHFKRAIPRIEKEREADNYAFDAILNSFDGKQLRTYVMGAICILCSFLYMNPEFINNSNYPYEDERLFTQYDKLSTPHMEPCRSIICNFLSVWSECFGITGFPTQTGDEQEDISNIREFLKSYGRSKK